MREASLALGQQRRFLLCRFIICGIICSGQHGFTGLSEILAGSGERGNCECVVIKAA